MIIMIQSLTIAAKNIITVMEVATTSDYDQITLFTISSPTGSTCSTCTLTVNLQSMDPC